MIRKIFILAIISVPAEILLAIAVLLLTASLLIYTIYNLFYRSKETQSGDIPQGEQRLREAERIAKLGSWEYDFHTKKFIGSDNAYKLAGISHSDKTEYDFDEVMQFIHPDDREKWKEGIQAVYQKQVPFDYELRLIRPDGEIRHIQSKAELMTDESGNPTSIIGIFHDVTESRELQKKVKEQLQINEKILENTNDGFLLVDENRNIVDTNKAYCEMSGYTRDTLLKYNLSDLIHDVEKSNFKENNNREEPRHLHSRHIRKNGELMELEASVVKVKVEGKAYSAGFYRDITEHKKAEKKLEESEQRWRGLVENNPQCVMISVEGKIEYINQAGAELFGVDRLEEVIGMSAAKFTSPEMRKKAEKRTEALLSNESLPPAEYTFNALDGSKKVVISHSVHINYKGKDAIQSVLQDVTELKKRERELEENRQQFKSLFEQNPNAVYSFDTEGNFIMANDSLKELTGYSVEELVEMDFEPLTHPEDREMVWNFFQKAAEGEAQTYQARGVHKDGHTIHVMITNLPIYVNGKIIGVFGIAQDITERIKTEEALKRSEKRLSRLFSHFPGLAYRCEIKEKWPAIFVSEGVKELTGYEPEAFLRDEENRIYYGDLIHEDDKEYVWKEIQEALDNNEPFEIEYRIFDKDGNLRWVWERGMLIDFDPEEEDYLEGFVTDITRQKVAEKQIRNSLHEKEVLLKEIHHRVKNNLAVISGLLELQIMNTNNRELQSILHQSQLRIHSMAMIHEKLYKSESFSGIGFDQYIQELVDTIVNTYEDAEKNIDIEYNLDSASLSINQAIPCALILNELVVNCYKHAFKNLQSGTISIDLTTEDEKIALIIADDGSGLPDDFDFNEQQSLGMTLVQTLVSQLNASISYESPAPDNEGTVFEITFEHEKNSGSFNI